MTKPPKFYDGDNDNAHTEFQEWRQQHQEGYFLNYKGPSNTMLHHVLCWHLRDPADLDRSEDRSSLTRHRKICSTDRRELRQWAEEKGVENLKQCQHCM
jgi:hypothetical protein